MTDEQREAQIASLTRELAGYEMHGKAERADMVRAELRKLAASGGTPHERAVRLQRKPRARTPRAGK